eukprot:scaffold213971_cov31-Tisochrysis_lutea.AAC.2
MAERSLSRSERSSRTEVAAAEDAERSAGVASHSRDCVLAGHRMDEVRAPCILIRARINCIYLQRGAERGLRLRATASGNVCTQSVHSVLAALLGSKVWLRTMCVAP